MKFRIFLTIPAILSIGLAQGAAYENAAAEQRNQERKEFALGFAIGLFGPLVAGEVTDIPDYITEEAIRGNVLQGIDDTFEEIGLFSSVGLEAFEASDSMHNLDQFYRYAIWRISLMVGFGSIGNILSQVGRYPITPLMLKGMTLGYQARSIKNTICILGKNDFGITFAATGFISIFAALKCSYRTLSDFWNR